MRLFPVQQPLLGPPLVPRSPQGEKVPGPRTTHGFLLVRCLFWKILSLHPLQGVFEEAALLATVGGLAEAPLALKDLMVRVLVCHASRVSLALKGQKPLLLAQQQAFVCSEFVPTLRRRRG